MVPILYEDNHLLVVEKPPNMPAQRDSSGDMDLLTLLKGYIARAYNKPGAVYLGLVHRLDRPVGGVMVFARTGKAAQRLSAQFRSREAVKRYVAVTEGEAAPEALLSDYIIEIPASGDKGGARVKLCPQELEGAKPASLRYHRIAKAGRLSLLDVELITGRKHQIRAQLASHGMPIRFDQRYNTALNKGQIALWAYALTITHPTKKEALTFYSLPKGESFCAFMAPVRGLRYRDKAYVLYSDEDMLIADKQAGVEVASADGGGDSLQGTLEAGFGALYPIHRIDANTRGLVLLAKSPPAYDALSKTLREGDIAKHYTCVVLGRPKQAHALLRAYAIKDAERALLRVYDENRPGAVEIVTEYWVSECRGDLTLLSVRLHTGRTHQIRAHLAHIGHPILGDDRYGDRDRNRLYKERRQALVAQRLVFTFKGEKHAFESGFALSLPD